MKRAPRLLIISTVVSTMRAFLLPYADEFRSRGWYVAGAAAGLTELPEVAGHFSRSWSLKLRRRPWAVGRVALAALELRHIVATDRIDIVHAHTPVAAFVVRLAVASLPPSKRPVVIYTAHGFHFQRSNAWWRNLPFLLMERVAARWTDYLVTVNREDYEAALRHGLAKQGRVRLFPGIGVDPERYQPRTGSNQPATPIPRIVVVGELSRGKRPLDIVFGLSSSRSTTCELWFLGTGVLADRILTTARELGIADRVQLVGFREDVAEILSESSLLVSASAREGLPRNILEAMSSGIPVIGTNIRGTRDLLASKCGLLYEVGDIHGLAKAIDRLLARPDLAHELGRAGREAVLQKYALSHLIELHGQLYAEALELATIRHAPLARLT
jgi:glycosyltransferase involved in cell wall biosynthesis